MCENVYRIQLAFVNRILKFHVPLKAVLYNVPHLPFCFSRLSTDIFPAQYFQLPLISVYHAEKGAVVA
jgi:hypothetical protein